MIYQLTGAKEISSVSWVDHTHAEIAKEYLSILDEEYGSDRNITSDGGYLLYCTEKSDEAELSAYFPYDTLQPEYIDTIYSTPRYQLSVYILATEYGVVVATGTVVEGTLLSAIFVLTK